MVTLVEVTGATEPFVKFVCWGGRNSFATVLPSVAIDSAEKPLSIAAALANTNAQTEYLMKARRRFMKSSAFLRRGFYCTFY
jgi:hypothetical protein